MININSMPIAPPLLLPPIDPVENKMQAFRQALVSMTPALQKSVSTVMAPKPRVLAPVVPAADPTKDPASNYKVQYGNATKAKGGGMGPASYGWSGRTGNPNLKTNLPYGFNSQMWSALQAANSAMQADGIGRFGITDGFRSYAAQVDVKKRKGNLAATPGRSVHGLGLAADLHLTSKQLSWLKQNGARYGLQNLPSESWHWQLAANVFNGKW